ncbi:MAG TPA: metallophosphoesterase [Pirellulales bacterium]|jgi:hypothetical protein|nr:metallophosphoesterase [Pirellulales bacterium]
MHVLEFILCLIALVGHLALCAAFVNRVHAMAFPRWVIEVFNWLARAFGVAVPAGVAYLLANRAPDVADHVELLAMPWALIAYFALSCMVGAVLVPWELARRWTVSEPAALVTQRAETRKLGSRVMPCAGHRILGRLLCRVPLNEALHIVVSEKHLELPRLPPQLDGLSIAHISDLHFTGATPERFFHEVVEIVAEMKADLICITGDLVEKYKYLPWLQRILGRVRAEHGVYYVLGNHDAIIDVSRIRSELDALGFLDLGGHCRTLEVNGTSIVLAGNELPWIAPAADPTRCPELAEPRRTGEPSPFSILLSHSPDQFPWAKRHGFDLMLAGHTHGGQIVFPVIGSILCPSRFGSRYAAGTFFESPTLMHVTRGVGGNTPLRWNCPPEVTRLVLCSPQCRDEPVYDRHGESESAAARGA